MSVTAEILSKVRKKMAGSVFYKKINIGRTRLKKTGGHAVIVLSPRVSDTPELSIFNTIALEKEYGQGSDQKNVVAFVREKWDGLEAEGDSFVLKNVTQPFQDRVSALPKVIAEVLLSASHAHKNDPYLRLIENRDLSREYASLADVWNDYYLSKAEAAFKVEGKDDVKHLIPMYAAPLVQTQIAQSLYAAPSRYARVIERFLLYKSPYIFITAPTAGGKSTNVPVIAYFHLLCKKNFDIFDHFSNPRSKKFKEAYEYLAAAAHENRRNSLVCVITPRRISTEQSVSNIIETYPGIFTLGKNIGYVTGAKDINTPIAWEEDKSSADGVKRLKNKSGIMFVTPGIFLAWIRTARDRQRVVRQENVGQPKSVIARKVLNKRLPFDVIIFDEAHEVSNEYELIYYYITDAHLRVPSTMGLRIKNCIELQAMEKRNVMPEHIYGDAIIAPETYSDIDLYIRRKELAADETEFSIDTASIRSTVKSKFGSYLSIGERSQLINASSLMFLSADFDTSRIASYMPRLWCFPVAPTEIPDYVVDGVKSVQTRWTHPRIHYWMMHFQQSLDDVELITESEARSRLELRNSFKLMETNPNRLFAIYESLTAKQVKDKFTLDAYSYLNAYSASMIAYGVILFDANATKYINDISSDTVRRRISRMIPQTYERDIVTEANNNLRTQILLLAELTIPMRADFVVSYPPNLEGTKEEYDEFVFYSLLAVRLQSKARLQSMPVALHAVCQVADDVRKKYLNPNKPLLHQHEFLRNWNLIGKYCREAEKESKRRSTVKDDEAVKREIGDEVRRIAALAAFARETAVEADFARQAKNPDTGKSDEAVMLGLIQKGNPLHDDSDVKMWDAESRTEGASADMEEEEEKEETAVQEVDQHTTLDRHFPTASAEAVAPAKKDTVRMSTCWKKLLVPFNNYVMQSNFVLSKKDIYIAIDVSKDVFDKKEEASMKASATKVVYYENPVKPSHLENIADKIFELHFNNTKDYDGDSLFRDIMVFLPGAGEIAKVHEKFAARVLAEKTAEEVAANFPIVMDVTSESFQKDPEIGKQLRAHPSVTSTYSEFIAPFKKDCVLQSEIGEYSSTIFHRRILLCTNVLETSFTTPVQYVLDSGISKGNFYNPLIDAEVIMPHIITNDSFVQRRGRVNRIKDSGGTFFPMYPREVASKMKKYRTDALMYTNLEHELCSILNYINLESAALFKVPWALNTLTKMPRELLFLVYSKLNMFCHPYSTDPADIAKTKLFVRLIDETGTSIDGAAMLFAGKQFGCLADCIYAVAYMQSQGRKLLNDRMKYGRYAKTRFMYPCEPALFAVLFRDIRRNKRYGSAYPLSLGIDLSTLKDVEEKIDTLLDVCQYIFPEIGEKVDETYPFNYEAFARAFKVSHPYNFAVNRGKGFEDTRNFHFYEFVGELLSFNVHEMTDFKRMWYEKLRILYDNGAHTVKVTNVLLEK